MTELTQRNEAKKYEWFLMAWGSLFNDDLVKRTIGVDAHESWFDTEAERDEFRRALTELALANDRRVMFRTGNGLNTRLRTVAKMDLVLPDEKRFPVEYDFGHCYTKGDARYMFQVGNLGSQFASYQHLSFNYPEAATQYADGVEIFIENFRVELV